MKIWNSEAMQLMRKNTNKENCILINCDFCRKNNKVFPEDFIAHMEMMASSTAQYYKLLNKELSPCAAEDIRMYRERIGQLKENTIDL
jgi:hypothetical protein